MYYYFLVNLTMYYNFHKNNALHRQTIESHGVLSQPGRRKHTSFLGPPHTRSRGASYAPALVVQGEAQSVAGSQHELLGAE